jgi:hypothetical protein
VSGIAGRRIERDQSGDSCGIDSIDLVEIESDVLFAQHWRDATNEALFVAADQFGHFAGLDDQCLVWFNKCGVHGKPPLAEIPSPEEVIRRTSPETVSLLIIAPVWPILPSTKLLKTWTMREPWLLDSRARVFDSESRVRK